jgi:ligand-binding SRPBCC domain-containing protein
MKIYRLYKKQVIGTDMETAWNFFSDPKNLSRITPKEMNFTVTSELPEKMYPGLVITYKVSPLLGIPLTWVTEITHMKEQNYFVDEQRFGPYKFWHHTHTFRETESGLEMEDIVNYGLPFGIFGRMAHPIIVKGQLSKIFDYRFRVLEDLFPLRKSNSEKISV